MCMTPDQVHDLLEQRKQLLRLADPTADDHYIPWALGHGRDEGGLGRFIEHDHCHGRLYAVLAEPGQFRIESRAESLPVDAGYRLRVVANNKCGSHAPNLPSTARTWSEGRAPDD